MFIIKRGGVKEVKKDGNVARYILYDCWCLEINSNIVPSFRNWAGVSSRIKWGRKCVCVCVFTARSYARVVDGGGQVIVTVWTDLTHVCISYSACHHADITCDNRSFFFFQPLQYFHTALLHWNHVLCMAWDKEGWLTLSKQPGRTTT